MPKELLHSLAGAGDFSSAIDIIRSTRYGGILQGEDIDSTLKVEKNNLLEYIKRDAPDEKVFTFFALPYDFDNFEAIAKSRLMGYNEKPFCELVGRYSQETISLAFKTGTFPYDNPFIKEMLSYYIEHKDFMSPRDINYLFVSYKYKELKSLYSKGILKDITDYLLDCENISILLRTKSLDEARQNFVAFGTLCEDALCHLDERNISSQHLREIYDLLSSRSSRHLLERVRHKHILEIIADYPSSDLGVFLSYIFRKSMEIKNLNMIFSLQNTGQNDKIKKMIIV